MNEIQKVDAKVHFERKRTTAETQLHMLTRDLDEPSCVWKRIPYRQSCIRLPIRLAISEALRVARVSNNSK